METRSRATLETEIMPGSDVELDIRFPITKVELKRGFWRGTMWIIRPKRGRTRVFSSEKEAREYAARIFGK
nr:MAG TPA: hypothetical protein [Caudoviricetes sp.]